ncbi:MAG: signal peptidase I, partial [Bacilli bacterium]|nr:signal peptidase I [Bacilli bacterium]
MKRILKENYIYLIIIILVILLKIFVITPVRVNGTSMTPTLKEGDIMLLNKLTFSKINRFDIVVVDYKDEELIKRVIGLPGERIEYKDNDLYVNGKKVKENFTKVKDNKLNSYSIESLEHSTIPKDYYFVVGDNRPNSLDSRMIGFIHKDNIMGKASFVIFPFSRFGSKK